MSVINQVLHDLEQQPQRDTDRQTPALACRYVEHPEDLAQRAWQRRLTFSLVLGVIALVLYAYTQYRESLSHTWPELSDLDPAWQLIHLPLQNKTADLDLQPSQLSLLQTTSTAITEPVSTVNTKAELVSTSNTKAELVNTTPTSQPMQQSATASQQVVKAPPQPKQADKVPSPVQSNQAAQLKTVQNTVLGLKSHPSTPLSSQPVALQASKTSQAPKTTPPTPKTRHPITQQREIHISEVMLTPQEQNKKAMHKAIIAEQKGDLEQAIHHYQVALKALPHHHAARRALATLWVAQNHHDQAEFVLQQGILLFPEQTDMGFTLAKLQMHRGHNQQALQTLLHLKTKNEDRLQHLYLKSKLAHKLQKFDIAEQSFKELVTLQPKQGRWWFGLAFALDSQKKLQSAMIAYQHAVEQTSLSQQAQQYAQDRIETLLSILQGST